MKVWDIASGNDLLSYNGHASLVRAVAWSPDGCRLASASADHTVQVWDATNGTLLHTYDGYSAVYGVAWSPDGTCIASGASNGVVVVWQAV